MSPKVKNMSVKFGIVILNDKDARAKKLFLRNLSLVFVILRNCVILSNSHDLGKKPDRMVPEPCFYDLPLPRKCAQKEEE